MNVLENRDYTVIVDRSGSMKTEDGGVNRNLSRWKVAGEGTVAVAQEVAKLDPDGITVYEFNDKFTRYDNQTAQKVADIFEKHTPSGSTELGAVLSDAINHQTHGYFARKAKGLAKSGETLLVVTDGEPNNQQEVAQVIISATKKLESDSELTITFIQVGHDAGASRFLAALDDELEKRGAKYDIVDVITAEDLGQRNLSEVLTQSILEHKLSAGSVA